MKECKTCLKRPVEKTCRRWIAGASARAPECLNRTRERKHIIRAIPAIPRIFRRDYKALFPRSYWITQ